MPDKIISDYSTIAAFASGDLILTERGSQYYSLDAANMVDHLTSDALTQGSTNKYATTAVLDAWLATKDTDDLSEGSTNEYASTTNLNTWLATKTLDNVSDASGDGRRVALKATSTNLLSAAVTTLNSTPVKIFDSAVDYGIPVAIAIKANAGGTTGYTVAGITDLEVYHGDSTGTTLATAAIATTPISFLAGTGQQMIPLPIASANANQKVPTNYDLWITCDSTDPSGGDVDYVVEVLWYELPP